MTTTFAELGLNEQILAGVDALGFTTPTPVQAGAIPHVLEGRDIVASAQTGTGKTAAFALPTLQRIAGKKGRGPHALIVTPTRELATQIDDVVKVVCEKTGQRAVIVMGGTKFEKQIKQLEAGCDLLVATPGRLLDLMEHDHVSLSGVEVLVLDEADRMLDMGFWPSVRRIMHALPAKHQTLLFSATIPPSIKSTIDALLSDPVTVEIARVGETADTVDEHLCPVTQAQKPELLRALLETGGAAGQKPERVLVFCRTKHRVDDVSKMLKNAQVKVDVMHADRTQKERERALERFRDGKIQVLVATDVMSRGIDVSGIDAVVNFDVPMDPEDYVHRIGRTGRAGHGPRLHLRRPRRDQPPARDRVLHKEAHPHVGPARLQLRRRPHRPAGGAQHKEAHAHDVLRFPCARTRHRRRPLRPALLNMPLTQAKAR